MEEFARRGDLSNTRARFQLGTLVQRSRPLSPGATSVCYLGWLVLAAFAPLWGSVSLKETSLPSFITSFPLVSLFLFLSAASYWMLWAVGRGGSLTWLAALSALFPVWDSIISNGPPLGLCCIPISSEKGVAFSRWLDWGGES